MTTSAQVLAVARTQIGTVEARDGGNPYGRAYGVDRVAWCAQFLWWCFREANAATLIHPKTAYTPTLADWFRQRGLFSITPQVGDLVFYDWPDSVRRIQHVGIVEAVEPAAIVAIEGNTSTADQSDGGRVMRRRRARNNSIIGYGHPVYAAQAPRPSPAPREDFLMALTDAEQREILDGMRKLKPGIVLPARSEHAGPRKDDAIGAAFNAWAEAADASAGVERVEAIVRSIAARAGAGPAGPPVLTDADRRAIAVEVVGLLTTRLAS